MSCQYQFQKWRSFYSILRDAILSAQAVQQKGLALVI